METPAAGPAKQENTPQQEKAKTAGIKKREMENKAEQGHVQMATPLK